MFTRSYRSLAVCVLSLVTTTVMAGWAFAQEEGERPEPRARDRERPDGPPTAPWLQRLRQGVEELQQQLERTENPDLRGQIERRIRRFVQQMERGEQQEDIERRDRERDRDEGRRRLRHLIAAVENLHAAGLHDVAEGVAQQAEELERAVRSRDRDREREPFFGRLGPPEQPPLRQLERLGAALGELVERVEQLSREVAELREQVARHHGEDRPRDDE